MPRGAAVALEGDTQVELTGHGSTFAKAIG